MDIMNMNQETRAGMHWLYFQICRDNLRHYELLEQDIEEIKNSDQEQHIMEMNIAATYSRRERLIVIPIVFGAMCLEAFIFDYGAEHLSASFVKSHIDKIDMPSKFVILPKLITGKDFPKDSKAYSGLVVLKKDRNKLVHFKSKSFSMFELAELSQWHEDMNATLKKAAYNAHDTILNVMKELDKLHDDKTKYYLTFSTDAECHA